VKRQKREKQEKLINRAGLVMVCLTLAALLSQAAAAEEMTLSDCISAALDANRDIAAARQGLDRSASGVLEARSGFLPSLSLSGSYNFAEKSQRIGFPLPGGGIEETEVDFTRDYGLQFSLSQALYTGGRLSGSYRISKLSRDAARADLERLEADVTLGVIRAFFSYLLARESVSVAEEAIRTAEEFLRVVRARYDAGEASNFEVMRAEVEVSDLEPALIDVRNAVATAELGLRNVMGMNLDRQVGFTGTLEAPSDSARPGGRPAEVDLAGAVDQALSRRPELRMMQARAEIAGQSLNVAKAGRLPTFSLSATYDLRSDALSVDSDDWDETYAGYLVMSLPIFDGLRTRSQIAASMSGIRQAEIAIADLRSAIELEVRTSLLDVDAAGQRLSSQEKSVEMAAEGLRIANERYLQGLATNLDVMDAQLVLTRARNHRLRALHDLGLARANLDRAAGVLVETRRAGEERR